MAATDDFVDRRGRAIKIKPILLSECCPRFLEKARLLGRRDPESSERQNHRANADVRLRALANMPAPRTPENCRANVPAGPNSLE